MVDIALRVAMGYLAPTGDAPSGGLPFVDGAFLAPTSFASAFPYLGTPRPGGTVESALALGAMLALASCGDDIKARPDGSVDTPDASVDAPPDAPPELTFTTFVIDLVQNHTADTTDPVPYAAFSSLPDPDLENDSAYAPLFP